MKPRPWKTLSGSERIDAVRRLMAKALGHEDIAVKLKADRDEIRKIAAELRREEGTRPARPTAADGQRRIPSDPAAGAKSDGKPSSDGPATSRGQSTAKGRKPSPVSFQRIRSSSPEALEKPAVAAEAAGNNSRAKPDWRTLSASEKVEAIRPHIAAGKSNTEIAARFVHCGRNQIAGIVNRMLVAGKPLAGRSQVPCARGERPPNPRAGRPAKQRVAREPKLRTVKAPSPRMAGIFIMREKNTAEPPPIYIAKANAFDPIPGTTPVPYGGPGCKWSVDGLHGPGLLWCGQSKEPEHSYCRDHRALAYVPAATRQSRTREEEAA